MCDPTALRKAWLFGTERTGTFVGYGLKYQGRWGNLSYIGEVLD